MVSSAAAISPANAEMIGRARASCRCRAGAGVIWEMDGLVLTNYRVVAGVRLRVMRGGKISFVDVNLEASGRAA